MSTLTIYIKSDFYLLISLYNLSLLIAITLIENIFDLILKIRIL